MFIILSIVYRIQVFRLLRMMILIHKIIIKL
uniref:Uncharacterized protein n=1 Tax=Podoviridae sp. ctG4L18 TaxID=2825234 RepID=A0A8S5UNX8_9CAUD|nr:MAG TPA: hypothetical protein [Caudoviricetes sp.]DAF96124.1 MAG TPA: hypothetical protein [Podoviridae sp. ctG4L18]